jgi:hypothetical protein
MRYQLWATQWQWRRAPTYYVYDTDNQDDYRLMLSRHKRAGAAVSDLVSATFIAESDSREALETVKKIHEAYYTKEEQ